MSACAASILEITIYFIAISLYYLAEIRPSGDKLTPVTQRSQYVIQRSSSRLLQHPQPNKICYRLRSPLTRRFCSNKQLSRRPPHLANYQVKTTVVESANCWLNTLEIQLLWQTEVTLKPGELVEPSNYRQH